jgi:hypothetical protein
MKKKHPSHNYHWQGIPKDAYLKLEKRFKMKCVRMGISQTDAALMALKLWIKSK